MIPRFDVRYSVTDLFRACLRSQRPLAETNSLTLPSLPRAGVNVFATRRGREALLLALKSLHLAPGARVGLPLFTCSVVGQTVVAAGLTPVFVDADIDNFGIDLEDLERKSATMDALVLVHTFGYPAPWHSVTAIMGKKPVIEDCAQGLGSSFRGQAVGSLGPLSIFSFGFYKPLGAGGGGCLVTYEADLAREVRQLLDISPREGSAASLTHAVYCFMYARLLSQPIYSVTAAIAGWRAARSDRPSHIEQQVQISPHMKMRADDRVVVESRLANLAPLEQPDTGFWCDVRKSLPPDWILPDEPSYGSWNHFIMPIRTGGRSHRDRAIEHFKSKNISASGLYMHCELQSKPLGYKGDCPRAERLAHTLFILPSYSSMPLSQRQRIVDAVDQFATTGKVASLTTDAATRRGANSATVS